MSDTTLKCEWCGRELRAEALDQTGVCPACRNGQTVMALTRLCDIQSVMLMHMKEKNRRLQRKLRKGRK